MGDPCVAAPYREESGIYPSYGHILFPVVCNGGPHFDYVGTLYGEVVEPDCDRVVFVFQDKDRCLAFAGGFGIYGIHLEEGGYIAVGMCHLK